MGRMGDFSRWWLLLPKALADMAALRTHADGFLFKFSFWQLSLPATAPCPQILDTTGGVACKSAAEWQAEMLGRVFFPHLLFALAADLKLLLWHSFAAQFIDMSHCLGNLLQTKQSSPRCESWERCCL